MRYVTHEMVERAREVDLMTYLKVTSPGELVRCGTNEYCTKEHDSLKISHGKWYWWSHGIGGASALDYLIKVRGMDFISAVEAVSNQTACMSKTTDTPVSLPERRNKKRKVYLEPYNFECTNVKDYLRSRGIDDEILDFFIARNMIAEDNKTHSALFFGLDEKGNVRQCSVRSTDGSVEKKDAAGSDRSYSFQSFSGTDNRELCVFECAIDLMSFATLIKQSQRDFRKFNLLSLSGVYMPSKDYANIKIPSSLERYLSDHPETKTIHLHLDNDYAGRRGAAGIQHCLGETYDVLYIPPSHGKDFNDYLMHQIHMNNISYVKETKNDKREKETQSR